MPSDPLFDLAASVIVSRPKALLSYGSKCNISLGDLNTNQVSFALIDF
jgi:hypothetical protein